MSTENLCVIQFLFDGRIMLPANDGRIRSDECAVKQHNSFKASLLRCIHSIVQRLTDVDIIAKVDKSSLVDLRKKFLIISDIYGPRRDGIRRILTKTITIRITNMRIRNEIIVSIHDIISLLCTLHKRLKDSCQPFLSNWLKNSMYAIRDDFGTILIPHSHFKMIYDFGCQVSCSYFTSRE